MAKSKYVKINEVLYLITDLSQDIFQLDVILQQLSRVNYPLLSLCLFIGTIHPYQHLQISS